MGIQITPSILNADLSRLADEVARIPSADWVHVDVMDNHFVPNLTLGLPVVESLVRATDLPLDVHLMVTDPDRWAPAYAEAGAGSVTFHAEAAAAPVRLARELRAKGARASMALKPATPVEPFADLLGELDMLLLMTVEPGFGGQKFLDLCLPKIRRTRELISASGLEVWLQVDGGVVRRGRRRRVRRRVCRLFGRGPRRDGPGAACVRWRRDRLSSSCSRSGDKGTGQQRGPTSTLRTVSTARTVATLETCRPRVPVKFQRSARTTPRPEVHVRGFTATRPRACGRLVLDELLLACSGGGETPHRRSKSATRSLPVTG